MENEKNKREETGFRVVLDTNILLSIFFQQKSTKFSKLFEGAVLHRYRLVISPYIIHEFAEKALVKFQSNEEEIQKNIRIIAHSAIVVRPKSTPLAVQRDPKDNHIIACALTGTAGFIVTGDKDLLNLKHYGDIAIIRPVDFLRTLGPE